jgi:hypothetical protein
VAANDLALSKADGCFAPLPIAASRTVATVGFPNIGLQDLLTMKYTNHTKWEVGDS